MGACLLPWYPTRAFPPASLSTRTLGPGGNWAPARLARWSGQRPVRDTVNELRGELGLTPTRPAAMLAEMEASRWPIRHGYSPVVVPTPPDWHAWHPAVGYWWPAAAVVHHAGAGTSDPSFRLRAAAVSERLSPEDGAARVVDAVARLASRDRGRVASALLAARAGAM